MSRFDYVKYDEKATQDQAEFKAAFQTVESHIEKQLGKGRASSLALTKLEEAYMWVGKQLRDDQIARNGTAELQEQRSAS